MLATRLALLISWLPTVETPDRGRRLGGTLNDQHSVYRQAATLRPNYPGHRQRRNAGLSASSDDTQGGMNTSQGPWILLMLDRS